MPLTPKGRHIMSNLKKEYGGEKGKQVFYAMKNAHKISGVDKGFYGHMEVPKKKMDCVKGCCEEENDD